ncbi:MAG TPA: hypothetical protein VK559_01260 [Ferruginibacter sp.]|nr:hypothetical protein [Ferruginibacter sp.]
MKYFFMIALSVLLFVSCRKSGPDNIILPNTISATINGTNYVFNQGVGKFINTSSDWSKTVQIAASDSKNDFFGVLIESSTVLGLGSYVSAISFPTNYGSIRFGNYGPEITYTGRSDSSSTTITITSVTDGLIQGTFEGTIYVDGDSSLPSIPVTNGKFSVSTN